MALPFSDLRREKTAVAFGEGGELVGTCLANAVLEWFGLSPLCDGRFCELEQQAEKPGHVCEPTSCFLSQGSHDASGVLPLHLVSLRSGILSEHGVSRPLAWTET